MPKAASMATCDHESITPAAFELQTTGRTLRYATHDSVLAAASTFGGRWRVTDPSGGPLFSLAPAGAPGTDDRQVVPHGMPPTATIMRDRRRGDSWVVIDALGALVLRATLNGPYELLLTDAQDVLAGRVWVTATATIVDFGTPPSSIHCLALALPLYFQTTGALRIEALEVPSPSLPLWS